MMFIKPKSKDMERILDRLVQFNTSTISPVQAQTLGKNKVIRHLRKNNNMHIAFDRKTHTSIVHIPNYIKLEKKGIRYYFEF